MDEIKVSINDKIAIFFQSLIKTLKIVIRSISSDVGLVSELNLLIKNFPLLKWYPEPDLNRHAIASEGF